MTALELLLAQSMCGGSHRSPCRYHEAQAKVALNALAGAGMVVVPREATEEMVRGGHVAWDRREFPGPFTLDRIYRGMVAVRF